MDVGVRINNPDHERYLSERGACAIVDLLVGLRAPADQALERIPRALLLKDSCGSPHQGL
jgi:hypothetical protein